MAQQQTRPAIDKVDPVWTRIRREAEEIVQREPEIASFIYSTILQNETLEASIVQRIADRLDSPQVSGDLIRQAFDAAIDEMPALGEISAPTLRRSSTATLRPSATSSRCFITKASMPSRPIVWRTGF